jgi:hypothetical protein
MWQLTQSDFATGQDLGVTEDAAATSEGDVLDDPFA